MAAAGIITYDELISVAARAVGKDRGTLAASGVGDDYTTLLRIPNDAVAYVGHARRWPSLIKALSISLVANDESWLFPADFECLETNDRIKHAAGSGYPDLAVRDLEFIGRLRAGGATSGIPAVWAFGQHHATTTAQQTAQFWPKADQAYTLSGTYRRCAVAMSATSDNPDLPIALHPVVRVVTRMLAREEFNQSTAPDWQQRADIEIERIWRMLCAPAPSNGPLRSHTSISAGLERGVIVDIDEATFEQVP